MANYTIASELIGKVCPICSGPLTADKPVVLCSGCQQPYHAECYTFNDGCATFGCLGTGSAPFYLRDPEDRSAVDITDLVETRCFYCGERLVSGQPICQHCGASSQTLPSSTEGPWVNAVAHAAYAPVTPVRGPGPGTATQAMEASGPHPWHRHWARMIDVLVGCFAGTLLLIMLIPGFPDFSSLTQILLAYGVAMVLEATCLSAWGTTLGKWTFSITVQRRDGRRLTWGQALGRALLITVKGLGLGIPLITLITEVAACNDLTEHGSTSWDRAGGYVVRHEGLLAARIVIVGVPALFLYFWSRSL